LTDVVPFQRKLRSEIPDDHCDTDDSRFEWLWMQRLATVASIYARSNSPRSRLAAKVVLDAVTSLSLPSTELILLRLEGGAKPDEEVVEDSNLVL
jgi:hypothetical protein